MTNLSLLLAASRTSKPILNGRIFLLKQLALSELCDKGTLKWTHQKFQLIKILGSLTRRQSRLLAMHKRRFKIRPMRFTPILHEENAIPSLYDVGGLSKAWRRSKKRTESQLFWSECKKWFLLAVRIVTDGVVRATSATKYNDAQTHSRFFLRLLILDGVSPCFRTSRYMPPAF